MAKRVFLFIITNILVLFTISIFWGIISHFFNLNPAIMGYFPYLLVFCAVWGMGGAFISLLMSKTMAKWLMGVKIIDPHTTDSELRNLVQTVHTLSRKAKLPKMPEVGFYESDEVNAFATGPSRSNSLVAVSSGLLRKMNNNQVEGVLGHEVAHIANGDMVTMTLIQGIVNVFVMFFARVLASIIGSQVDERYRFFVEFALIIALQIAFGILGALVVNYFSRKREYKADYGGAQVAGKNNMINALRGLLNTQELVESNADNEAFQSLKISNKKGFVYYLSTHPPLEERIAQLERTNVL